MKIIDTIAGLALGAAAMTPVTLAAQERSSTVQTYHLMQLTVQASYVTAKEFSQKTGDIRSCEDARALAVELDADVKRNRFVRATSLPSILQDALKTLPAGQATKVFSNDPEVMRVLVLCNRDV